MRGRMLRRRRDIVVFPEDDGPEMASRIGGDKFEEDIP